ncbi:MULTISPECIES: DUF5606 domain-containing protein [unclassified Imperialibacter]|uniref:DUF5606 family protein n=1 Tax=unclassified Imperialibacter TaxID=2629706 RepID=UPI001255A3D4|nr:MULTISPECIES: DUF5606 domain-containing protein [unclassified Imperialibacter]CAD5266736.1 conserved hypothetical protein [Imperialibacter sp. 75]CAD5297275.1 conserved hypothetical protein [Imperialibacter sp. 89]VVT27100.1 conserved hypothetical protein [Imperialibacter sp. EC-SDR9]
MEFKEIATVSGKGGLYKVLNPTRSGVILESLDEKKSKLIVNANSKVSILHEISIYTTDNEGTVALEDVMRKVHKEFAGDTGLTKNSDNEELKSFLKHVLPTYDADRVYVSDIKKLVNWYSILVEVAPEVFDEPKEEVKEEKLAKAKAPKEAAATKTPAAKAAEKQPKEEKSKAKPAAKKKSAGK